MQQDYARPGFQIIMRKMKELSNDMLMRYDAATDMEEVRRIQAYRDVVEIIIPKIMEDIMNVDEERSEPKWTFKGWLRDVWHCVDDYICNGWMDKAKRYFAAPPKAEEGR